MFEQSSASNHSDKIRSVSTQAGEDATEFSPMKASAIDVFVDESLERVVLEDTSDQESISTGSLALPSKNEVKKGEEVSSQMNNNMEGQISEKKTKKKVSLKIPPEGD